jgi:hypothetical protein
VAAAVTIFAALSTRAFAVSAGSIFNPENEVAAPNRGLGRADAGASRASLREAPIDRKRIAKTCHEIPDENRHFADERSACA